MRISDNMRANSRCRDVVQLRCIPYGFEIRRPCSKNLAQIMRLLEHVPEHMHIYIISMSRIVK